MTKISLTPVIDVVFILLIFFMLASNFNKVGEVDMDMTKESTTSSKEDIKIIKLLVRQDQTVLSEGKVFDDSELLGMLNMATKDSDKYSIILTSKDDVTYQRFLNLISYLKTNELSNISIGLKKNEISN
uniref:Predicted biopolymer transport protein blr3907 n=1 Tax=uncultured bacterium BAC13K9BAC TaxID=332979 RepID=Q4JN16_9BACT|nr:predicted biopolymer transport protein blr3907 [uncultured bacterium BAC13K9BAC]